MSAAKTVLITGCSKGGVGDALAREFHRRGHAVFACARSGAKMAELAALGIRTLELDVGSPAAIAAALEAVRGATPRLDVLINNAGVNYVMPFADSAVDEVRNVLETNVVSVFAVTQAFLPLLIEAKGVIANIGSVNQALNPPYQSAYTASKAALAAVGNTLRVELAPFGVRVVTVVTGSVRSRLFDNADSRSRLPQGSLYAPLKERIDKRDFLDGITWTSAEEYAKQIATDLLKPKPKPVLWRATFSTMAWFVNTFLWQGALASLRGPTRPPPSSPKKKLMAGRTASTSKEMAWTSFKSRDRGSASTRGPVPNAGQKAPGGSWTR